MNVGSILLAGFAATILMTTMMAASQGLGYTRMSIPFLLGTIFTASRDRAMVFGVIVHTIDGLLFALLYGGLFELFGSATILVGAGMGVLHGLFVLTVGMLIIPGLHPRMVSEYYGPTPNRMLQPPGFLALHYGRGTPVVTLLAHVLYGAMLGGLYRV
ncbi:MAG TPA: hypothetical protein VFK20_04520 [Vicinamibacterales bacterium]|nr:hypothetical protein [Vicinamibacterales bacterium]